MVVVACGGGGGCNSTATIWLSMCLPALAFRCCKRLEVARQQFAPWHSFMRRTDKELEDIRDDPASDEWTRSHAEDELERRATICYREQGGAWHG